MTSVQQPRDPLPADDFRTAVSRRERLARLSGRDVLRGIQAFVYLPLAAILIDRWGLQRVQQKLAGSAPDRLSHVARDARSVDRGRRLAWVVGGVARRGPWKANCLQRSLVLWWFLLRRGMASEIRIGVRRRPGAPSGTRELDFHAWVEYQGVVLNDRADVREIFATFDRAIVPVDAHWR